MKKRLATLMVAGTMTMSLLTACSSKQETAAPANNETTKAEVTEETPAAEQVEEEVTEEPELESETEPETEAVVYEGIDMESTLPGVEWIDTFNGIIHEPKLVVFNDETNKKIILENGQKVEFSKSDSMIIYIPTEKDNVIKHEDFFTFARNEFISNTKLFSEIIYDVGYEAVTENVVEYDGQDCVLTATLVVVE